MCAGVPCKSISDVEHDRETCSSGTASLASKDHLTDSGTGLVACSTQSASQDARPEEDASVLRSCSSGSHHGSLPAGNNNTQDRKESTHSMDHQTSRPVMSPAESASPTNGPLAVPDSGAYLPDQATSSSPSPSESGSVRQHPKYLAPLQVPGSSRSSSGSSVQGHMSPKDALMREHLTMEQASPSEVSFTIGTQVSVDGSSSPRVQVMLRPKQVATPPTYSTHGDASAPSAHTTASGNYVSAAAEPASAPLDTAISIQPRGGAPTQELATSESSYYTTSSMQPWGGAPDQELQPPESSYHTASSMRSHSSSRASSPQEGVRLEHAGGPHPLLPAILAPLQLKGDYCEAAALNASDVILALAASLNRQAQEVVLSDGEAVRVLFAHMGLPVSMQLHHFHVTIIEAWSGLLAPQKMHEDHACMQQQVSMECLDSRQRLSLEDMLLA